MALLDTMLASHLTFSPIFILLLQFTAMAKAHDPNNYFTQPPSTGEPYDYSKNEVVSIAANLELEFYTNLTWYTMDLYQQIALLEPRRGPNVGVGYPRT